MLFNYSGRTEFQHTIAGARMGAPSSRRSVQFERKPSKRYDRRQSHIIRDKMRKEAEERKNAPAVDKKDDSKSQPLEIRSDKSELTRRTDSVATSQSKTDDIKTENRKSGCEPINKPCSTNIIDEDPLLIPIPPISARSNSAAKKTVGSFQTTSKGGSDTKSDLNTNKDGIGGISQYSLIIFS